MYNVEEFIADSTLMTTLRDAVSNPGEGGVLRSAKLKITPRCNLRCRMCSYWKYKAQSEMSPERLMSIVDEFKSTGVRKIHISGGEPMIVPHLFDFIERSSKNKIRINLTTNGTLVDNEKAKALVKAGARSVSVSIDGPDAKTHDGIRGVPGAFKKAVAAIEKLARARERYGGRKKMRIRVNTVLQRPNWRDLPDIIKLAGELGVDEVHPMPVDPKDKTQLIKKSEIKDFIHCITPEAETLRIKYGFSISPLLLYPFGKTKEDVRFSVDGRYARGFFEENLCYVPWLHMFVAWDGSVYPCCMTRGRVVPLGNLSEQSVEEVFYGDGYAELRKSFVKSRLPDCARCDNFLYENRLLAEAFENV